MSEHPTHPRTAALLSIVALCLSLASPAILAEDIPARLDWSDRVQLGTPVSGVITEANAEAGQQVRKGDVLVRMDDRAIRAQLEEAEAQVRRLELARAEAELEYERAQDLYDRTLISQRELSENEIAFAMADAALVAARARLTLTQLDLEYSQVRAPFDGLVLTRHVRVGETVNNELQVTPLVTLASADPMLARGEVAEEGLAQLRTGQPVRISVGERRYDGVLRALGLEPVDPNADSARFAVMVEFRAPAEHGLRAGQRATMSPGND